MPAPGDSLVESLELTAHAVERFAARWKLRKEDDPRPVLRELIRERGEARRQAPAWFRGARGLTDFYVVVDGDKVLPAAPAKLVNGEVTARPYVATTFVSQRVPETELAELNGEDLANLVSIPPRIVDEWAEYTLPADVSTHQPEERLRKAIAEHGRATAESPSWLGGRRMGSDSFLLVVADSWVLEVRRANRTSGARGRFSATRLFIRDELLALKGETLLASIEIGGKALQQYRKGVQGVSEDARADLSARIVQDGKLTGEVPDWAPGLSSWRGPVVQVDEEFLLLLKRLHRRDRQPCWRAVGCVTPTRRAGVDA